MIAPDTYCATDPSQIGTPEGVVLPGVGDFGACMTALRQSGFDRVIHELRESAVPILGICVGMQMLFEYSSESGGHEGLGLIPGQVRRLEGSRRLPQMQWNQLELVEEGGDLYRGVQGKAWVYFVHSYAVPSSDYATAYSFYGQRFVASIQSGRIFGTQYHPEKSSRAGIELLSNFVSYTKGSRR